MEKKDNGTEKKHIKQEMEKKGRKSMKQRENTLRQ
jgi:hypothetical protein